jgi:MFS transporter, UMF1 family
MATTELNNKKTINAWAIFDWANSAYALVISTAIFPGYFEEFFCCFILLYHHSLFIAFAIWYSRL